MEKENIELIDKCRKEIYNVCRIERQKAALSQDDERMDVASEICRVSKKLDDVIKKVK